MSVIDYLLLFREIFPVIDKFIVCDFTEFSAHAPLHVQLVVTADLHTSNIPCVDVVSGMIGLCLNGKRN